MVGVGVVSGVGDADAGDGGVTDKGSTVGSTVVATGLFSATGFGLEGGGESVAVLPGSIGFDEESVLVGSKIWMTGEWLTHILGGRSVDT